MRDTDTLFMTDLDGTLLQKDTTVSARSRELLRPMVREGLPLTYGTARSFASSRFVARELGLVLPVVVYSGAAAVNPADGRSFWHCSFTRQEARRICAVFESLCLYPLVYAMVDGQERVSWLKGCERNNPGLAYYLSNRQGDGRLRAAHTTDALYAGEPFYYTCIGTRQALAPAAAAFGLEERCRCMFQKELGRSEFWCEVMPRDASKGAALRRLKEEGGFHRTVVFGDSLGDITLFEAADEGYAVASAPPELRALATDILPDTADCVALWMAEHWNGL